MTVLTSCAVASTSASGRLEQQLVMDLQQHAGVQPFAGEGGGDAGHRALDDVGGRALQRRVDRLPLGAGAARRVGVADPRDEAFAPEDRLDIAGAPAIGLDPLHIGADRRETVEIGADIGPRLALRHADLRSQAKGADAVDDAEIDRLRPPPRIGVHLGERHAEHLARGQRVNVDPVAEGLLQLGHVGDMGGEPQLDLAVIGRQQQMPGLGDKGAADAAAFLGADRDVLQVGVVRREPPGRRHRERVGGVHAPAVAVDLLGERVGIGRFELGQLAPFEDVARHLVQRRQLLEDRGVGAVGAGLALLAAGQAAAFRTARRPIAWSSRC